MSRDAVRLAEDEQAEAARLQAQARELEDAARLEDVNVWEDCIVKQTKKGEKKYGRWLAGWREGGQAAQGLPGVLQEAEPGRGPAKSQEDEGRGFRDTPQTMIIIRNYLKYLRPCPMSLHQECG